MSLASGIKEIPKTFYMHIRTKRVTKERKGPLKDKEGIHVRSKRKWFSSSGGINQLNTLPLIDQSHVAMTPHVMDVKSVVSSPFDVSSPIRFYHNNASQAEAHYKGNKHARMVKGLESNKTKQKGSAPRDSTNSTVSKISSTSHTDITEKSIQKTEARIKIVPTAVSSETLWPISPLLTPDLQPSTILSASTDSTLATGTMTTGASGVERVTLAETGMVSKESDKETAMKLQYCSLCKVGLNSLSQLHAHNSGTKHKTMMAAQKGLGPIKVYPKPHFKPHGQTRRCSGLQDRIFHCQLCGVCVNSEMQLKQHISSRRHKDRVAGKTPKPKPGPKKKLQLNFQAPAGVPDQVVLSPSLSTSLDSEDKAGMVLEAVILPEGSIKI
ncbi:zinc finger protein 385B-like [Rhincodon typus]|uniref:zinc finger protein 385B-like n=1 Tax=Rhincodon typus TaxID=259920 RepID=UPI00202F7A6E|nr:zinc finger protein 385B-like [Rhincodon typus]